MENKISNYDIMKRRMAGQFAAFDTGRMAEMFALPREDGYIYMDFVGRRHRIDERTGECEHMTEDGGFAEAGFNAAMTLYDILSHCDRPLVMSEEFVPIEALSTIKNASSYAGEGMFQPLADSLDGRDSELAAACEALGGFRQGRGDVSYRIPAFGDIHVIVSFWDSDEEFPASLKIYVGKNLTDYMHYETIWYLACHVMDMIEAAVGDVDGKKTGINAR